MKKKSLLAVVFFLSALVAFGEELTYARPKTNGLDIELSQVHLIAATFDEECIAYRFELAEGKKTFLHRDAKDAADTPNDSFAGHAVCLYTENDVAGKLQHTGKPRGHPPRRSAGGTYPCNVKYGIGNDNRMRI